MEGRNRMAFALISGTIVISVSVFVAYICFNILESSAEGSLQNWKFGGAFAGFVFTASLLTSIIFQFYKQMTHERIEKYRQLIQELETKLIKGAPCPTGYTIDLDERHNLVFARPSEWLPRGGILYQYVNKNPVDVFNANFNVIYQGKEDLTALYESFKMGKFDPGKVDFAELYELIFKLELDPVKNFPSYEDGALSKEYILVDGIKSLKYIHTYTFQPDKNKIRLTQSAVFTYLPRSVALYQFTFSDNEEDYLTSSEVFNTVVRSIRFL